MDRCPTCRTELGSSQICRRCKTDLRQIFALEQAAVGYQRRAFIALREGRWKDSVVLADRACEIHRSPESLAIRAVIALASGDFKQATDLWHEIEANDGHLPVPEPDLTSYEEMFNLPSSDPEVEQENSFRVIVLPPPLERVEIAAHEAE